jgi:hypothetical protein
MIDLSSNRIIYCFWFGPEMSPTRSNCLLSLQKNSGVKIQLITEENLKDFILPSVPLHKGFQYLSSTHKSDYLRSYFMYYYGGGYTDIKKCHYDWNIYFDMLDNSDKDFIGSRERAKKHIANYEVAREYQNLVTVINFIFKPKTNFAKIWYDKTQQLMDEKIEELVKNPGHYHPRAILGGIHMEPNLHTDSKYPFEWNELLGRILHKLQWEHYGSYLFDMPFPDQKGYR